MIAPLRSTSKPAARVSTQPIGQLLPQVLARYGISMTAEELAAFDFPRTLQSASLSRTPLLRIDSRGRKKPRRTGRTPPRDNRSGTCQRMQQSLFLASNSSTAEVVAIP
jgi:hypothetical protein